MKNDSLDEEQPEVKKPKPRKCNRTFFNWQTKQLDRQLESKLPNEFRDSLKNYNCRSYGDDGQIDENSYSIF